MLAGLLIGLLTGLLWTLMGIIMSRCAKNGVDFPSYFAVNFILTAAIAAAFDVKWSVVFSGQVEAPFQLLAIVIVAGFFNATGLLIIQKAMKMGHNGTTWAIGQSAMIIPFLAGVLIFKESADAARWLGAGLIAGGMLIPSLSKWSSKEANQRGWATTTLIAFLLLGFTMALLNAPSYWKGWHDNANLRAFSCYASGIPPLLLAADWRKGGPLRLGGRLYALASGMAVINIASALTLFACLDLLAKAGAGPIGYPLMIGTCIACFSLYSLAILRERGTWADWTGLAMTICGMAAMAF